MSTWCIGALPVRSPMPFTLVVNTSAPEPSAITVFHAPSPRSLWKCTTSGASGAAAFLAADLDRCRALLARVSDRLAHHAKVGVAIVRNRELQPLGLRDPFAMQQRLAQLVLDVKVGRRREDEIRNLVTLVAERVDHAHRRIDVAFGRAHHADDLEVGSQLSPLPAFEHESQRFALALRDGGKPHVHDVDANLGEHARELVLVLWRDGYAGHLLAVAQGVVVDANLVRRRELQVVRKTGRVAGEVL